MQIRWLAVALALVLCLLIIARVSHLRQAGPDVVTVTPAPATEPAPLAAAAKGTKRQTGCAEMPSRCGYPDRTNVGVPPGTHLRVTGSMTIRRAGATVASRDIRGTLRILADNVEVKDTIVAEAETEDPVVFIGVGVSGTVIEDSTIRGLSQAASGSAAYAILNANGERNGRTRVLRVQMYDCDECFNGPGTVADSYLDASSVEPGAHYEAVYYGGGARLVLRHDTLLNPHPQTAAVYTEPESAPVRDVVITDNLIAGGGWTIYGGGPTATRFVVTDNRFSRIFYPSIGHFGLDTAMNWPLVVWSGNYYDENLRRVP
jgi:hypothetical protein